MTGMETLVAGFVFIYFFIRIKTQGTQNVSALDGLLTINISSFSPQLSLTTTQIAYKYTSLLNHAQV